jgi:hypothetical protein
LALRDERAEAARLPFATPRLGRPLSVLAAVPVLEAPFRAPPVLFFAAVFPALRLLAFVAARPVLRAGPLAADLAAPPVGALAARAAPPSRPPFRDGEVSIFFPRPDPLFFPPPVSLFTVAQARRSASFSPTPRFS